MISKKPILLNIETSTRNCSVSVTRGDQLIAEKSVLSEKYLHSEILTNLISNLFNDIDLELNDLDAVSVGMGPGSYTGLRIGVSTAKGLCYALEIPLISVSSLKSMSLMISKRYNIYDLFCPMIDARRMEVYSAFYNSENKIIRDVRADIITDGIYKIFLKQKVLFFGDGSLKCKEIINSENAYFLDNIFPNSCSMIEISYSKYVNSQFEDLAYFEPFYLKDFVLGKK